MDILNTKIKNILTEKTLKVRPENIKKDISILGITGTYTADADATANDIKTGKTAYVNGIKITGEFNGVDTSDADATAGNILNNKTAYVDGTKLTGSMPNNGSLSYTPSDSSQSIPAGYTSGGTVAAADITTLDDYESCDIIATNILYGASSIYTQLQYIQSSGTQYIDTGIVPDLNTKVIIDFKFTGENNAGIVFGTRQNYRSRGYWVGTENDVLYNKYWQQMGAASAFLNIYSDTNRHTIEFSSAGLYIDGTLASTISPSSFIGYTNLYIFKSVDGANNDKMLCQRLFSIKMYNNNNLVRDFIPVKDLHNVVCLFDNVSQTFFYNLGTGNFIAGEEVVSE